MNLSEGQKLALIQIQAIESESENEFEILGYNLYGSEPNYIKISISIAMRSYEKKSDGFDFRLRERFNILVHKNFPFQVPSISFIDSRYIGKPHVQWGKVICLYQSIEVDYDPADGMFGVIGRLNLWLRKASLGELDPNDEPLHPPVAYVSSKVNFKMIPNKNVPDFKQDFWLGAAKLEKINEECLLINEWYVSSQLKEKTNYAAVILLNQNMPFEYPYYLRTIIDLLKNCKVDEIVFLKHLQSIIKFNKSGTPLFVIIGSPMRGDTKALRQHLLCWYLESKIVSHIRGFDVNKIKSDYNKAKIHFEKFQKYVEKAEIQWCKVLENRNEIVYDRDQDTLSTIFKDKTIEIWGCGALGSHIAEIICRAKPKKIIVIDNGIVKPGLLVRQLFNEADIGINKAEALKNNLSNIYVNLIQVEIESRKIDILNHIDTIGSNYTTDFIIDTTASLRVLRKIDALCNKTKISLPILSFVINHNATKAMIVYKSSNYRSGLMDIIRESKLKLCEKNDKQWLLDFFTESGFKTKLFQPEPGCSDPTFIGSEADLNTLSGLLVNQGIKSLNVEKEKSKVVFISQELDDKKQMHYDQFSFENNPDDKVIEDPINGYKIILPLYIFNKIVNEIKKSDKIFNPPHETGGLLFGEWDDLSKVVYINEVSGAPPDSKSKSTHFECGVKGTKELNQKLKIKFKNSVYFVGLWHSHPFGSSQFSGEDKLSMQLVVTELSPPKSLLLIIAYNKDNHSLGGFVFTKSQFK